MPTRLIREGIISSDRVERLDWAGEVFYRRLMSKVDDHGLYDARPTFLRAVLYPLRVDRVREADISRWIAMCEKAGLIVLYEAGGKPYLQMLDTGWEKRGKPKYPIPKGYHLKTSAYERKQLETDVSNSSFFGGVFVGEGEGEVKAIASSGEPLSQGGNGSAVIFIPLNDGTEFPIPQALADELDKLYPNVDVMQTLREIRGWNLARPRQRKTKRGILAHVNTWFNKEQNKPTRR